MTSPEVLEERIRNMSDSMHEGFAELKMMLMSEFEMVKLKQDKTNGRVRSLEVWRAWMVGFGACLAAIVLPVALVVIKNTV
jgi:hypothetical protein